MAKPYSEDLRIRVVRAYEGELGSIREIAKQFQVGKTFVNDLIQQWRKTGSVSPLPHAGGVKPKLEAEHLQKLQQIVETTNDATLSELSEQLETETGVKVSVPTIYRGIERLGLTRKKTFHDPKQESEEVKEQKKNYQLAFWEIVTKNLVFLDETGMRLNFTRTHGRSKRGKRCHGQRPKPKGKIVTLIGAMCITGVIASLMFEGGTNTETFLCFVREILVPALWKGAVVVMDNLNVHTNQLVIEAIESVGAKVLFLPTYSPELNPIEMLWSKLKAFLRKLKPRTRADLDVAVSTSITSLQQKDLLGYFLETEARTVFISKLQ